MTQRIGSTVPAYQPKGGMCLACERRREDCSGLDFAAMPVVAATAGVKIVRCTDYTKRRDE